MGMNFKLGFFDLNWPFWVVIAAMLGIAALVCSPSRAGATGSLAVDPATVADVAPS
jgi:hypothetical protein